MSIFPMPETVAKVLENNDDWWKLLPKQNKLIRKAAKNGNNDLVAVNAKKLTLTPQKYIQLFPLGTIWLWSDPV